MNPQEYRGLKSEIIEISKLRLQLAIIFLTLMGTLIGYVYGKETPTEGSSCDKLILGASVVFLILSFFIERLRCHLRRLTTYIYVFFENTGEDKDYKFEGSWKEFRKERHPWSYSAPIAILMSASLALSTAVLWHREWTGFNQWKIISIMAALWGAYYLWFSTILKVRSNISEQNLIRTWKEIKGQPTAESDRNKP